MSIDIDTGEVITSETKNEPIPNELINNLRTMFVTGDLGEGKTAICYYFCDILKKRGLPIYVLKHPNQELIIKRGYRLMRDLNELEGLRDIVLWIDEPQIVYPKYDKRGSIILNKILSLARQKDLILIISTSDTRYITIAEEFYISTYIIKKIDYKCIKKGSVVKRILDSLAIFTGEGYAGCTRRDEYIFYNKHFQDFNGKHRFTQPVYFDEKHSKPFSKV